MARFTARKLVLAAGLAGTGAEAWQVRRMDVASESAVFLHPRIPPATNEGASALPPPLQKEPKRAGAGATDEESPDHKRERRSGSLDIDGVKEIPSAAGSSADHAATSEAGASEAAANEDMQNAAELANSTSEAGAFVAGTNASEAAANEDVQNAALFRAHLATNIGAFLGSVSPLHQLGKSVLSPMTILYPFGKYRGTRGDPLHPLQLLQHPAVPSAYDTDARLWRSVASENKKPPVSALRPSAGSGVEDPHSTGAASSASDAGSGGATSSAGTKRGGDSATAGGGGDYKRLRFGGLQAARTRFGRSVAAGNASDTADEDAAGFAICTHSCAQMETGGEQHVGFVPGAKEQLARAHEYARTRAAEWSVICAEVCRERFQNASAQVGTLFHGVFDRTSSTPQGASSTGQEAD